MQNVTIAFASNSSNPLFVSLGIVALKVSDPAADAAAAEAAAKNEVTAQCTVHDENTAVDFSLHPFARRPLLVMSSQV